MKLINILLKNITPEDWPEKYPFATQDKGRVYFYDIINKDAKYFIVTKECDILCNKTLLIGKKWSKNIVNRDEFIDQYNNPWIKWKGGKMPVKIGTLVDVQYSNKEFNYGVKAGICIKYEAGGSHKCAIAEYW